MVSPHVTFEVTTASLVIQTMFQIESNNRKRIESLSRRVNDSYSFAAKTMLTTEDREAIYRASTYSSIDAEELASRWRQLHSMHCYPTAPSCMDALEVLLKLNNATMAARFADVMLQTRGIALERSFLEILYQHVLPAACRELSQPDPQISPLPTRRGELSQFDREDARKAVAAVIGPEVLQDPVFPIMLETPRVEYVYRRHRKIEDRLSAQYLV